MLGGILTHQLLSLRFNCNSNCNETLSTKKRQLEVFFGHFLMKFQNVREIKIAKLYYSFFSNRHSATLMKKVFFDESTHSHKPAICCVKRNVRGSPAKTLSLTLYPAEVFLFRCRF